MKLYHKILVPCAVMLLALPAAALEAPETKRPRDRAAAVTDHPPFPIAGFNINMYGRDRLTNAVNYPQSLDQLATTGSNTVMVTVPYFQATGRSNEIGPDPVNTETDEHLAVLFDALRARGFRVAFKFTVIPKDGAWSGDIHPSDPAAWFASYRANLVRLASLGQTHGVTLLYIANEMQSMATATYAGEWNTVIDGVRQVYSGELSWNAVLNAQGFPNGEAFTIPVASRLDHIGLSFYEPLTNKTNPSVDELVLAWYGNRLGHNLVAMVKALHDKTSKPIVFSEINYRSVDGNNIDPTKWRAQPDDVIDPQEQADCYEAFMRVWTTENQSWMLGVLWWQWMIEPKVGRDTSHDQTPQNLPAQAVITKWFGGTLGLSVQVGVNQPTFGAGEKLAATVGLTDPGLPGAADLYMGFVLPDETTIILFTSPTAVTVGRITDLASFDPIAAEVALATSFSVTVPNFFSYTWTGQEPRGSYVFFLLAVKAGALTDGVLTTDEILRVSTATFTLL